MCLWAGWGEGATTGTPEAPMHPPQAPHTCTVRAHIATSITPTVPSRTLLPPSHTSPQNPVGSSGGRTKQDLMGGQVGL